MNLYQEMGISPEVLSFSEEILAGLKDRFEELDKVAEYNQYKVLHAMQKNRVSAECFAGTTGYGHDDLGRDVLEKVYADVFHTEAALVRPQITCGTHALATALSANLLPGDELGSHIADYANNPGNLMVVTEALPVKGQAASYQVSMTYMYFKASNSEAFDLNIALPAGKELPLDAPVVFTLGDDSTVELKQQRAGDNVVYLYPTAQQVKQLAWKGIKKIEFGLVQADTFPDDAMSAVIDKLYNSLMAVIAI